MKVIQVIAGVVVTAAAIVAVNTGSAEATNNVCKIEAATPVTVQDHGKNFTFNNDGTVTAKFKVTGNANCKKEAVFASWKMPKADGQPLEDQKLYDYAPKKDANGQPTKYGPGIHQITIKVPDCYYQLDLLEGWNPTGFNGTANYGNLMHPIDNTDPLDPGHRRNMLDTKMGGDKSCEDVCPNLDGTQGEVPEGHEVNGEGKCVVPEEPETPEKPGKGAEVKGVTEMPKTGAGSVAAAAAGVTASAGAAHAIVAAVKRKLIRR